MGDMDFAISASALSAQRRRMDVIAANLANAESTRTAAGGPYRRRDVVLEPAAPDGGFADMLSASGEAGLGVRVRSVVEDLRPPRLVFDPGHPDADAEGFVAMPNVNVMSEMVDMMAASRAYEANVTALNVTKRVLEATLDLGR
jgi:flagellar basal-body rod protein FlgC